MDAPTSPLPNTAAEDASAAPPGARRGTHSDMGPGGWLMRMAPARARPYLQLARIDRPIGTWLLMLPCWWGVALALAAQGDIHGYLSAQPFSGLYALALFAFGALAMRGAGCVVNDIADRDFDRQVARTRTRPLASGALALREALVFLAGLLLLGLIVLVQLSPIAAVLALAILPVVVAYPYMKRITWWPQVFLGIAFNWGALVAFATMTGTVSAAAACLYVAGLLWTLGYDTIYAHQDKEDDALIGVRSTARLFGARSRPIIAGFYLVMLLLLAAAGLAAELGPGYWPCLGLVAAHLLWQLARVDFDDPASCLAVFRSNRWTGLSVFAALIAGSWNGGA